MKHRSSLPALACVGGGILCVAIGAGVRPAGGVAASPSFRLTEAEMSAICGFDGGGCSTMLTTAMGNDCGWTIPAIYKDCWETACVYCQTICGFITIRDVGGSESFYGQVVGGSCAAHGSKIKEYPCTASEPCTCNTNAQFVLKDCPKPTIEVIACAQP